MSHTTTLKGVQIKSQTAIRKAVADLQKEGVNITLKERAQPRMYYDHQAAAVGICDFVLSMPQSRYDVGLKWNEKEKQYDAILDTWGQDIRGQIGATCAMPADAGKIGEHAIGRFTQRYAVNAAKEAASAQGYYVEGETIADDGSIHLVLAGM